jgi:hypothetical protein
MRRSLLTILLLAAFNLTAQEFRFEPAAPTSDDVVLLQVNRFWRDSCVPRGAVVSRNGNRIEVLWTVQLGFCLGAFSPWIDTVRIGVLEAGTYDVRLRVDDFGGVVSLGLHTIVVGEASPAFTVNPAIVPLRGGTVNLQSNLFCLPSPAPVKSVVVGGIGVPFTVDPCSILVQLPAHGAGAADISVQINDTVYRSRAAVRYIDPAATPDSSVYERILIPVRYDGGGSFGSQWRTTFELHNLSSHRVEFLPDVMQDAPSLQPLGRTTLDALTGSKGAVIFVPRNVAGDLKFGLLVRDVSRESAAWGTEIPVVRERDASRKPMMLANVPFDARYRLTLRLYSIDGGPGRFRVVSAGSPAIGEFVELAAACAVPPCNSTEPGFAAVDLNALLPGLANKGAQTLYIETPADGRLYWALVSITNNTTQVVTTISPQ